MKPSIDKIKNNPKIIANFGKIGIVVNQTSITSNYEPSCEILYSATKQINTTEIACVFGPQHGYFQTEQDNMRETPDDFYTFYDGKKVPLYSLYSKTREPTAAQMETIDTLIVDLQDIGCRVYTYMLTLAACLKAAAKFGKKVVVLDRPNPLGLCLKNKANKNWNFVEGDRLELKWHSFVGWYDIPMRHGLTMGELGYYFIKYDKLNVDYKVISVDNLSRNENISSFKSINWAMPSPNIPCWESAYFFPSFVILEGTNISEGRGSTIPFQLIGAPWLNNIECLKFLNNHKEIYLNDKNNTSSIVIRPHNFRPTFNKHHNQICYGLQFHIENPQNTNLFNLGITFLTFCNIYHKETFKWSDPGYEYNYTDLPINLIYGTDRWLNYFNELSADWDLTLLKEQLAISYKSAQNFINEVEELLIYRE